jgi:hypothetical protein
MGADEKVREHVAFDASSAPVLPVCLSGKEGGAARNAQHRHLKLF